ncbi:MAG: hypothetical protein LBF67_02185 [Prevotellaceae bacterium]|jgi:hypothetical protein|nr:hypothetical protein [Prevotellaceae bacterium]
MKKIFIVSIGLMITQIGFAAQNSKTFWGEVSLGYGRSIGDYGKNYDMLHSNADNMYMASLKAKAGYYVIPQLSLGVGVGLSGYHNPNVNTLPVFLEARYNVKFLSGLFSFLNAGTSLSALGVGAFQSGGIIGAGAGYSIKTGRRTALNISVGYDALLYKQTAVYLFTDEVAYSEMRHRHTMFLQLGFEF